LCCKRPISRRLLFQLQRDLCQHLLAGTFVLFKGLALGLFFRAQGGDFFALLACLIGHGL